MPEYLHIVTHDVPYPADFGGVVDIFYKIKCLHAIGIKIHLHCFVKNRAQQPELEKYCKTVSYYKRKSVGSYSSKIPYIVSSRKDSNLLINLQKDNHPILFEGVHSTYYLYKNKLKERKTFLRLFNVEFVYYKHLATYETNLFKKLYYKIESKLLAQYEKTIAAKTHVLTLSLKDSETYIKHLGANEVSFVPAFHPYQNVTSQMGKGSYCLYHGNLAINENEKAVVWLIEKVFAALALPFVIAGRDPSTKLKRIAKKYKNISIVATPSEINMQLLIQNAQINILPSFNDTGVKLKLLNALFNGRHCLVNLAGVAGSGLNELCNIAETPSDFIQKITQLFEEPFSQKEMQHRSTALKLLYDNEKNARFIYEAIQ